MNVKRMVKLLLMREQKADLLGTGNKEYKIEEDKGKHEEAKAKSNLIHHPTLPLTLV